MPNLLVAGNSTNGGTAISTDTSGTLNIVTGSGSGANAITIDASQAVTMPGNLTVSGTLTASGGVSGSITRGTAVASTSGTSIDFTSLPTGIRRITVMLNGVSLNGSSNILIQIGSGSVSSSGYVSSSATAVNAGATSGFASTAGFIGAISSAGNIIYGNFSIVNFTATTWVSNHSFGFAVGAASSGGGNSPSLSGSIDRVRITTVNGTDTFDAGSINLLWE
jgi:hypothetical protein